MSNAVILPLTADRELVIASDNSGAIGEKEQDAVHVPNKIVAYYASRVAMMECLAAGGEPGTVVMQNFTDDEAWAAYAGGVKQVMDELGYGDEIPITGSTESNFPGLQSGLGITIIGTRPVQEKTTTFTGKEQFAVIGTPLVGNEVMEQVEKVAPLSLFKMLCQMDEVKAVLPVGSKGIAAAWRNWINHGTSSFDCELDLEKSAGPATCFILAYEEATSEVIQNVCGNFYHALRVVTIE